MKSIALTRDGTTRRLIQDRDGRLLGEYAANASQLFSEYIWLLPDVADGSLGDGSGATASAISCDGWL